jgi:hypothetical protein
MFLDTYCSGLIAEKEWLVGQHVRQDLEVILAKLYDFLWFVHTHTLCLYLLGSLKIFQKYVSETSSVACIMRS